MYNTIRRIVLCVKGYFEKSKLFYIKIPEVPFLRISGETFLFYAFIIRAKGGILGSDHALILILYSYFRPCI